jgi:Tfp pilus assembly protein PilF
MNPEWFGDLERANRLFDEKEYAEAEALTRGVLERAPESALAHQLLGLIHVARFEIAEGEKRLQQALAIRPDLPTAHNSLGHCRAIQGREQEALAHFNTALCLEPRHALAHYNRATVWLKLGRFREGWAEHEWRFAAGVSARQPEVGPLWDGGSLEGRALLVYTEQGLGDTIQFARFLPMLRRRARRLVVATQHPLRRLLEGLGCVDSWFPMGESAEISFDVHVALMSVPALLRLDERSLPRVVPYLFAEPERVAAWRPAVRRLPGYKVGVCWQGNPMFPLDRYRSIPLRHFAPLAATPGVSLVSLQRGPGVDQIETNRESVPLTVLPELDRDGAFLGTAAVIQNLDLVISADTAVAHLAGAMGKPVWLLLSANGDWRWQIDRADSPWYPTMRLFRQRTLGDWSAVFAEVAEALGNAAKGG